MQGWADAGQRPLDPFALVAAEISSVSERLRRTIVTDIPVLSKAAEYFFQVRPCTQIILRRDWHHPNDIYVPCRRSYGSWVSQVGTEGKRLRPTILLLMASALTTMVPAASFLAVDERPASEHVTEARRRQLLHA